MPITITRQEKGFTVEATVGSWKSKPVVVTVGDKERVAINNGCAGKYIIDSYSILTEIFETLYRDYTPINFVETKKDNKRYQRDCILKSIAKKQCKIYSKKLKVELHRLRELSDQDMLQIQKMAFSCFGPKAYYSELLHIVDWVLDDAIDKNYCLNDLKKYKALYYLHTSKISYTSKFHSYKKNWLSDLLKGKNKEMKETILDMPAGLGGTIGYQFIRRLQQGLDNAPKKLNRTEVRFTSLSGIVATSKEIIKSVKLYERYARTKLKVNKLSTLMSISNYIQDFPGYEDHKGSLVGLMRKSIHWHRNVQYKRNIDGLDPKHKAIEPPDFIKSAIAKTSGIRFLSTVEEIGQEGVDMQHCIGGYARYAVKGQCFLFHIEKYGEHASVELRNGWDSFLGDYGSLQISLGQSYGPKNTVNRASRWAKRFFNKILAENYNKIKLLQGEFKC